jgi:hypothetical protein
VGDLMTLEPDGQAAACKAVQVGSIPTGVFYEATLGKFDIAGPAAQFALTYVGWRGVFRTWNLIKAISSVVSSEGRAPDHYSGCHRFDSCTTQQVVNLREERCVENTTTMKA